MPAVEQHRDGLHIAYIGGGSRDWAWTLIADLALEPALSGTVHLYDIDFEAAKTNEMIGNNLVFDPRTVSKWKYCVEPSLEKVLTGADFVIISILPGTFDEMAADLELPQKYGIYQSVGDTVGPGGIMRSMRTIPMIAEIGRAIAEYAPGAWVINYTNPMTVCTRTLYSVFPQIKAFGCCHEVFHTQELMVRLLETERGITGVQREEIRLNVLGINHFTWFDEISRGSENLLPLFAEAAEKYCESGYAVSSAHTKSENTFRNQNKVGFDLFRRFGLVPVAGDRHIAEFLPPWYLRDEETIAKFGFALTPISWRRENRKKLVTLSREYAEGRQFFKLKKSDEEGIRQIKAVLGMGDFVTNVNLPNAGQMAGLPLGAVVETNALLSLNSIRPVFAGKLPDNVNGVVLGHVNNQENIVKAGLAGDTDLAFSVFLNDSQMVLPIERAQKLFGEMFDATRHYLKDWSEPRKIFCSMFPME
ncbi:MAG: alpha-glucosidase/alpha-galactosidase [Christensenellales bacterium]|jgi:alpha-galactosidase/6-phospho-beta-glucosidase family protein